MAAAPASRGAWVVCGLLLGVGLLGCIDAGALYQEQRALQESGPRTAAVVLEKRFLRAADGDSDYLLKYRFSLPSGEPVLTERGVSKQLWERTANGREIMVVYAADNPRRNFPEGDGFVSPVGAIVVSAVFGCVGALGALVLFGLWRGRRVS